MGEGGGRMWGETALSASAPGDPLLSTPQGSSAHWGAGGAQRVGAKRLRFCRQTALAV